MQLSSRPHTTPSNAPHCVLCRETTSDQLHTACSGCAAPVHTACMQEFGARVCPTPGCARPWVGDQGQVGLRRWLDRPVHAQRLFDRGAKGVIVAFCGLFLLFMIGLLGEGSVNTRVAYDSLWSTLEPLLGICALTLVASACLMVLGVKRGAEWE